jgi:WD40 repeat protein/energy-coupling factor transporter ATP-binding protein EcfA2
MDEINLLELIKRRFAALLANVHPRADPKLVAEVPATLAQADSDLPAVFMRARRVLEIIVLDIYRRELPTAKPKPLADMIEALYAQQGVVSKRVAADLHYIRVNGNLIIHPQDEAVEIRSGDAEPVLLVFLSIVEWYLTVYLPERLGDAPARAPTLPPPPNPYRGLLAFREADAGNWFGREPDAADLLAAIARQPLVAVVGPSGSGKSSLVYAGVVPPLRATDGTRIADFRPRGRPFAELAQALVALWPIDPADRLTQARKLAAHLADGQVTLTDAVQETLRQSGGSRLLLIADQFEELYTLAQPNDEAQGFMDLLAQAVQDGLAIPNRAGPPELCLLLTLRADFLGQALAHPGLAALLDRCPPKLLGPVEDRARLRAIIEQPARGVGVALEELLPERILRDLAQLPGTREQVGGASLPLLEFTLAQLWDQQQERRLTHRGYEALSGIQQALSRHADGVLARLDPADQARMRHVLVQMVRPGEGTEDTRQVATRAQLHPDDWPLVVRLADADTRLVVTGHDETTEQDTAELVHETLIRHWQPLRDWITADRAFRLWQNGLRQAMAEWTRTGHDDGALLAGARLAEAEERIASDAGRVSAVEVRYVQASVSRRVGDARRRRAGWTLAFAALVMVLLIVSGLGGFAYQQAVDARRQADEASQQRDRADEKAVEATQREKDARHNIGLTFVEKADRAVAERRFNEARLYALHALDNFDPEREGSERATGIVLSNPVYPLAFASVDGLHHDSGVWSVSFSPDGRMLATGSADKTIRLWDVPTGKEKAVLAGHSFIVSSVSFSPDGQTLASGSWDETVRLWDVAKGQQKAMLVGRMGLVCCVSFSPDGRMLAFASIVDHRIWLWDLAAGRQKVVLAGHTDSVWSVSFSPDGRTLASGSSDHTVRLWDVVTGEQKGLLTGHTDSVVSVHFSPDGGNLASGSWDQTVRLWDVATGQQKNLLAGHSGHAQSVSFSPDGRTLASGSGFGRGSLKGNTMTDLDMTVRLWDVATGQQRVALAGYKNNIRSVSFSPDGLTLASGSDDGTMRLWDLAPGLQKTVLEGHTDSVNSVSFAPNGRTLASASDDRTIRLWDLVTCQQKMKLDGHAEQVNSVAFAPDGASLVSGSDDHTVRLWDAVTGRQSTVLGGVADKVETVSIAINGRTLASGSSDSRVRLWDVGAGQHEAVLAGHTQRVSAVSFSPNGRILASASSDKTVRLWDVATGQQEAVMEHTDQVHCISFSPDGRSLASGSGFLESTDSNVLLWDVTTGLQKGILAGHTESVQGIDFSPDGQFLASGSGSIWKEKAAVRLWEAATNQLEALLAGHSGGVSTVEFSRDGQTLASGSDDNTIRLWNLSFLHDSRPIADQIQAAQRQFNLHLVDLQLEPIPPEEHPDGTSTPVAVWSEAHPFHWLPAAEAGDAAAMLRIGLIYHRADDFQRALDWYRKAAAAGNSEGAERLAALEDWLKRQEDPKP